MSVLTLDELKEYLRYDSADTSNDTALGIIVDAAQRWVENYTGHLLAEREVVESPVAFPVAISSTALAYFDLRWKPADTTSIEIAYLDADLQADTFTTFTTYMANGTVRVIPETAWPTAKAGITLNYTAGYADVDDIPDDLLHAVLLYAGMSDEDRAAANSASWKALDAILLPYRLPVLA